MKKRIAFHTLGCKLNFSETSTMARPFRENDYDVVDFREEADIYVINTCSVTHTAEKKCRLAIRQANRRNPSARIAVVGCFSQLKPNEIATLDGVDLILGSNDKFQLFERIDVVDEQQHDFQHIEPDLFIPAFSSSDRTRSFVKIQDGCDYYCSYCTIPMARGHSRSGSIAGVLESVSEALLAGSHEIVLTGVNIGDFGRGTNESLLDLLKALDQVTRIPRIRISSVEPDLLNDQIIEWVAGSQRIMPHFHIPMQSGSEKILKAMKRKYGPSLFSQRVLKIKDLMPDACIAADVIVGFPGETASDFGETMQLVGKLPLSYVHVFSYSSRPGTLAGKLPDPVPSAVISERSHLLQALSDRKKHQFYVSQQGKMAKVLFESAQHQGLMHGFTENYIQVAAPFLPSRINQIVELTLTELSPKGYYLHRP